MIPLLPIEKAILEYVKSMRKEFAEMAVTDEAEIFEALKEDLIDRLEFVMENN